MSDWHKRKLLEQKIKSLMLPKIASEDPWLDFKDQRSEQNPELAKSEDHGHPALNGQSHAIISLENAQHPVSSSLSHDQQMKHLNTLGSSVEAIRGKYGKHENSFIIHNPKNIDQVKQFAHSLGQDSIISSSGGSHQMHFLHGPNAGMYASGQGHVATDQRPDDYYSEIPTTKGMRYVTYNFDFNNIKKDELPGGKGDDKKPSDFDPDEFEMGLDVEAEHTGDYDLASEIVADHLSEDPKYYTKLKASGLADELEKSENNPLRQIADSYNQKASLPGMQHTNQLPQLDPNLAGKLAQAHTDMQHDPHHPEVKKAYTALANETVSQYHHLLDNGYKFSPIQPGQANPYPTSKHMLQDVHQNKHLWYFPSDQGFGSGEDNSSHPLMQKVNTKDGKSVPANDIFRAVHDIFGHAKEGNGFGPRGEEAAWSHHMQMFTPDAQKALTAETRLQNHWVNWGPHQEHNKTNPDKTIYAPQKAGLPPSWALTTKHMPDTQKDELTKGAMKRVAPFNPVKDVPEDHRKLLQNWVKDSDDRHMVPPLTGAAKTRGMVKLYKDAVSRKNPETNEREYLLFRGKTGYDHKNNDQLKGLTSFTPDPSVAQDFNKMFKVNVSAHAVINEYPPHHELAQAAQKVKEHNLDSHAQNIENFVKLKETHLGGVYASWVPESAIHHIPNAVGEISSEHENTHNIGQNHYEDEKEVIVNASHPKFKHVKLGPEHMDLVQQLHKDHLAKQPKIVKSEDIFKAFLHNGNWRPEPTDPDGMSHPDPNKPYVKGTDSDNNPGWTYRPDIVESQEKDFMQNYNNAMRGNKFSPEGKKHLHALSRQILSDPDRHMIGTLRQGKQVARLRHLNSALRGQNGYSIKEHQNGLLLSADRHPGTKNTETSLWHFDGAKLNNLK